jgi:aspartyl-tRNA synthetase
VTLGGWVDRVRDHKGVIFIDLRDRYGRTQVVVGPESPPETLASAKRVRPEWVVLVRGTVNHRPEGTLNPKLPTFPHPDQPGTLP